MLLTIQHNSPEKIVTVDSYKSYCLRGCLCFALEGHDYSLNAGVDKYAYTIVVDEDNMLNTNSIWYNHDYSELQNLLSEMCEDLDVSQEKACNLLDESEYLIGEDGWLVQQFQGIAAHKLGYDCAVSDDEQGIVYIAYCVDRNMTEIKK